MRISCLAALCVLSFIAQGQDIPSFTPPNNCRQVVLVVAPSWSSANGILQRLQRSKTGNPWQQVGASVPVLLGRHGLAWAGEAQPAEKGAPQKAEGDQRSPAGVFTLGPAFGRGPRTQDPKLRLPFLQIVSTTEAIDDPQSRYYGQIVDRESISHPDWRSSEHMGRISAYDIGAVIGANPRHQPGAGSCIFLHLWLGGWTGTSGCTALHRADLEELLQWLDPAQHPLLVQVPEKVLSFKF